MLNNGFPAAGSVEKKEVKSLDDKYRAVFISLRVLQILLVVFAVACVLMPDMAFAAGGLTKTKRMLDRVSEWLQYLAISIATIAIFIVGYKVLFGGQTVRECAPILIGCAILAGGAEIVSLLLG